MLFFTLWKSAVFYFWYFWSGVTTELYISPTKTDKYKYLQFIGWSDMGAVWYKLRYSMMQAYQSRHKYFMDTLSRSLVPVVMCAIAICYVCYTYYRKGKCHQNWSWKPVLWWFCQCYDKLAGLATLYYLLFMFLYYVNSTDQNCSCSRALRESIVSSIQTWIRPFLPVYVYSISNVSICPSLIQAFFHHFFSIIHLFIHPAFHLIHPGVGPGVE